MQPEVQILPQTLINKIAAGEVIVRPASVVKELVENSFDAGARHIRVDVGKDGRSISVADDGCGMDEANAKRAILRNSTSKIRDFEDLDRLTTRGFRGEAVASIISVSRFEMLTRPDDAMAGTRILAEGGQVMKVQPTGTAPGTTIHVRELFYNTPARLKFLKSPGAEYNILVQLLTQQALSHPEVALACARDGVVRFDLPAGQDLRTRIEELLGSLVQGKLVRVHFERDGFSVRGYVCRPEASRKDRRWQFLMVNGRPIGAKQLSFPIQEAYRGLLMTQRFPIVVLDMGIDMAEVDVNVHPTKEEVRFEDERKVAGLLHRAINDALSAQNLIPTLSMPGAPALREPPPQPPAAAPEASPDASRRPASVRESESPGKPAPAPSADPTIPFIFSSKGVTPYAPGSEVSRKPDSPALRTPDFFPVRDFTCPAPVGASSPAREPTPRRPAPEEAFPYAKPAAAPPCEGPPQEPGPLDANAQARLSLESGAPPEPLGQIARTYIVAQWGEDLLLIDQHAAHERLLYQRLTHRPRQKVASQPLLIPIPLEISTLDAGAFETLVPLLAEMGLETQREGSGAWSVTATPADLELADATALVRDMLDDMERLGPVATGLDALRDRVLIRMACHAAIKGGQQLHRDEMVALLRDMAQARLTFTCPHGRPTMVLLRKSQLDRQFGRLV